MAKPKTSKVLTSTATTSMLHMLHRASQYSEDLFVKATESNGLTARQLIVLEILAAEDKPSQTLICAKSGIDRSTLADVVRRLVSRGLLARRRSTDDARAYAVRITDEGQRLLSRTLPKIDEVDRLLNSALSADQRPAFAAALWRIVDASSKEPRT